MNDRKNKYPNFFLATARFQRFSAMRLHAFAYFWPSSSILLHPSHFLPNTSPLFSHPSPLLPHLSSLASPLLPHPASLTPQTSSLTPPPSSLLPYPSPVPPSSRRCGKRAICSRNIIVTEIFVIDNKEKRSLFYHKQFCD